MDAVSAVVAQTNGPPRRQRRFGPYLLAGAGLGALVAATAILVVVVLPRLASPAATPGGDAEQALFPPPSLDAAFPAFPLPAGAALVNATTEGQGTSPYRAAVWTSPLEYEATSLFYSRQSDSRWHLNEQRLLDRDTLTFTFSDSTGAYETADLSISRTDPVRIALRIVPSGEIAAPTIAVEGSPIAFGPLPVETMLPAGIPSDLVPPDAVLVDGAEISGVASAHWQATTGAASIRDFYAQALAAASPTTTELDGVITITFARSDASGTVVLDGTNPAATDIYLELVH